MPQPAISIEINFAKHLNNTNHTRVRMEKLYNEKRIARRDIEQVYVGLYIDAISGFERLIENLFIGLLLDRLKISGLSGQAKVKITNEPIARQILTSGDRYIDWLPYSKTEDKAKAYFNKGRPFTKLDAADKEIIQNMLYVRNAMAHNSQYSKKKYNEKILNGLTLLPQEKKPAGFLRNVFRTAPDQTRYENYILEMLRIASKLCS